MQLNAISYNREIQLYAGASLFDDWNSDDLNAVLQLAAHLFEPSVAAIAIGGKGQTAIKVSDMSSPVHLSADLPLSKHDTLLIDDIQTDLRFSTRPFQHSGLTVRSFCSIPLLPTPPGCKPAFLCILDAAPGRLSSRELASLELIGKMASRLINLRVQNSNLRKQEEALRKSEEVRRLVTLQLDEQKEFYENILNKLPTDIVVFDADHKYLFVNPGAISVEEYRNYIIGKDDYEYAAYRHRDPSTADSRRQQFLRVKYTGKEIRWEDSMKDAQGNTITHLRRMYPVHDDSGKLSFVIGFGIDITDRKIMEEKQTLYVEQLKAKNTQLVDYCNIVSHNLRAPLVNMGMLVKFIEESDDTADQLLLVSKLHPVVDNLNATFNELVESIQIKQDLDIKSETILLADMVSQTILGLQAEITQTGALIETDFENPSVRFPTKYMQSIFYNLISNSLKYYSPERIPSIKIHCTKRGDKVLLSVSDNGLGIDLVKHSENFFKIGKVFHRHPNAKGFGLYMTKTQVEAMDGKIWVESIPDLGTTIFIEFSNQ